LISCRQMTSGEACRRYATADSRRALTQLMFQVVTFLPGRRSRESKVWPAKAAGSAREAASRQMEKLVPQPHEAVALGLFTRNDAPMRSSTKSISEPARKPSET